MNLQDEAHAVRLLNKRLVRLHRDAWARWQSAARAASYPRAPRGARAPRRIGRLPTRTVRGIRPGRR